VTVGRTGGASRKPYIDRHDMVMYVTDSRLLTWGYLRILGIIKWMVLWLSCLVAINHLIYTVSLRHFYGTIYKPQMVLGGGDVCKWIDAGITCGEAAIIMCINRCSEEGDV
jgi:hypothetical protein